MSNYLGGQWNKKDFIIFNSTPTKIKSSFNSNHLAVLVTSRQLKVSSKTAGIFYQFIETPFGEADVNDFRLSIPLHQFVVIELKPISSYKLRFEPVVENLPFNLTILEPTMPLYPITSDPTPNPSASSTFVSSTAAITSSASVKVLSVNLARKAFSIYNSDKTNSIYVDVVSTISTSTATFIVPPGQAYISDFDWTGEVWAITKSGNINATVREFS